MTDHQPIPSAATILVIGANGFVGRRTVRALTATGCRVRALVRRPDSAAQVTHPQVETFVGDMLDPESLIRATAGVEAVYVSVHTLSRQRSGRSGGSYTDVEATGLTNIVAAAKHHGVRRILYVTSLGVAPDATNSWLHGRHRTERMLLDDPDLDATVLRPGMIVGRGGAGFDMVLGNARRRFAAVLAPPAQRFRPIAVDDLAQHLVDLRREPRSYGHAYDVGADDVLTMTEMIDLAADQLGRPHPRRIRLPRRAVARLAPLVERATGLPPGALDGLVGEGSDIDLVGDPTPIRALLPTPRTYRQALAAALSA